MKNPYIVCQTNVIGLHQLYIMIWLWSLITRPSKDLLQWVDRLGLEITVLNIHLKTNNCIIIIMPSIIITRLMRLIKKNKWQQVNIDEYYVDWIAAIRGVVTVTVTFNLSLSDLWRSNCIHIFYEIGYYFSFLYLYNENSSQ